MHSLSSPGALRRVPTRLVVVAGIHLALIWALINGVGAHILKEQPTATEAMVIDPALPPPVKFVPPDPTLSRDTIIRPEIPPVADVVYSDLPTPPTIEPGPIAVPDQPIIPYPPAPIVTGAAVDPRHPLTQPAYPMASIRNNESGALSLSILVGTDGRVHDAKVIQSSGSPKLDQAAVNEAKTRWHLRPARRDGVPFEEWLTLRVVFRLEGR